jgi:DNA-binding XRE family transcriptional regulator
LTAREGDSVGATFNQFLQEIEEEAGRGGPEVAAELDAFRLHYQLARELLELRRSRNLTQKALASLSGVGQSEISKIESGRANPTVDTLAALAVPLKAELHFSSRPD